MRTSLLLRWAWALLPVVAVHSDDVLYKMVGDSVVLLPRSSLPSKVISIIWKDGDNIAVQWYETDSTLEYNRQYKNHTALNTTTAALTIADLTPQHNAKYSVYINEDLDYGSVTLVVLAAVPVPSISHECHNQSCVLTCSGDTSGAKPVTYTWRSGETEVPGGTSMELHITKETGFSFFTCDLKNPVSLEGSPIFHNPLISSSKGDGGHGDGPKISVGLTVFISLLACLLMLVLFHRWKAGMWFFEKESIPWTADFWRREEDLAAQTAAQTAAQSDGGSQIEERVGLYEPTNL